MHVLNHLFLKEPLPLILHQLLHTLYLLVLHQVHGETSILHRFPLTFLLLEIHLLFFSKSLTLVFFVHHPLQHMSYIGDNMCKYLHILLIVFGFEICHVLGAFTGLRDFFDGTLML